jgi:aspartate oxidase
MHAEVVLPTGGIAVVYLQRAAPLSNETQRKPMAARKDERASVGR